MQGCCVPCLTNLHPFPVAIGHSCKLLHENARRLFNELCRPRAPLRMNSRVECTDSIDDDICEEFHVHFLNRWLHSELRQWT
eukprot:451797-Pelagomonas_calceolata.AAC.1